MTRPSISIITPSYRNSRWLQLCIPSVADQGVALEHIVQDAGSDDGTLDWLPSDPRVQAFVEKDRGMYDAVNRGLRRARGDILGYINCDEQYLPGALRKVLDFFARNPKVDVVFADTLIIDATGRYICHRKGVLPGKLHTWLSANLSVFTCATFFRRRLIDEENLFFNPDLRDIGDGEWIIRLLNRKISMAVLREFTSVFTETGSNMNLLPNAAREKARFIGQAPAWLRALVPAIILHYRLRRWWAGAYRQEPFEYAVYTEEDRQQRRSFRVSNPTFRWIRPPATPALPIGDLSR